MGERCACRDRRPRSRARDHPDRPAGFGRRMSSAWSLRISRAKWRSTRQGGSDAHDIASFPRLRASGSTLCDLTPWAPGSRCADTGVVERPRSAGQRRRRGRRAIRDGLDATATSRKSIDSHEPSSWGASDPRHRGASGFRAGAPASAGLALRSVTGRRSSLGLTSHPALKRREPIIEIYRSAYGCRDCGLWISRLWSVRADARPAMTPSADQRPMELGLVVFRQRPRAVIACPIGQASGDTLDCKAKATLP